MKAERVELINNVLVKITVHGDIDGDKAQFDIDLQKVTAHLNSTAVFQYQDGEETGILRFTDIGQHIMERASNILYQEKFEYENNI